MAVAGMSLAAALQAVDGIALKFMVDRWSLASTETRVVVFEAAFAVRQIEIGPRESVGIAPWPDGHSLRDRTSAQFGCGRLARSFRHLGRYRFTCLQHCPGACWLYGHRDGNDHAQHVTGVAVVRIHGRFLASKRELCRQCCITWR